MRTAPVLVCLVGYLFRISNSQWLIRRLPPAQGTTKEPVMLLLHFQFGKSPTKNMGRYVSDQQRK